MAKFFLPSTGLLVAVFSLVHFQVFESVMWRSGGQTRTPELIRCIGAMPENVKIWNSYVSGSRLKTGFDPRCCAMGFFCSILTHCFLPGLIWNTSKSEAPTAAGAPPIM